MIVAMISRHSQLPTGHSSLIQTPVRTHGTSPGTSVRSLSLCALWVALAAPLLTQAGELMPFEIPEEEVQWDQVDIPEFNTALPEPPPEPAKPVDPGPDWPAPAIDAYVDVSFSDARFNSLGYSEEPGGYRFVVGFRLDRPGDVRWSFAPEFGYSRIGRAERKDVSVYNNIPGYTTTETVTHNIDLSALDFGARVGYRILPHLDVYGRGGMQFYHISSKTQTTLDFTPLAGVTLPRPREVQRPASTADAKLDLFGTLGVSLQLGDVPSFYVEYGARQVAGELVSIGSMGVLLNF